MEKYIKKLYFKQCIKHHTLGITTKLNKIIYTCHLLLLFKFSFPHILYILKNWNNINPRLTSLLQTCFTYGAAITT